jgi:hypothetical protein
MVSAVSNCSSSGRSAESGLSSTLNSTIEKIEMLKKRVERQKRAFGRAKTQKDKFEPQAKNAFTTLTEEDKVKQTANRIGYEKLKMNAYRAQNTYKKRQSTLKESRKKLTAVQESLKKEEEATKIQRTEDFVNEGGTTPPHVPFTVALQQKDQEKENPFNRVMNWSYSPNSQ